MIGEDNSTDGTREICKKYAEENPDKIRLFLRRPEDKIEVQGKKTWHYNYVANIVMARGKYIALCDGDDFWTDQNKLQKQYDLMESDDQIMLSHHAYSRLYPDGSIKKNPVPVEKYSSTEDIIRSFKMRTCTTMYRNIFEDHPLPGWFYDSLLGDIILCLHLSRFGKTYGMPDNMAVYRTNATESIIKSMADAQKANTEIIYNSLLNDEDFKPQHELIKHKLLKIKKKMLYQYAKEGKLPLALNELSIHVANMKQLNAYSLKEHIKIFLKMIRSQLAGS